MDTPTRSANVPATADSSGPMLLPAIELTGSRFDRLHQIDAAMARLARVRRELAGEPGPGAVRELPARRAGEPAWPWFAAGMALAALVIMLALLARGWA